MEKIMVTVITPAPVTEKIMVTVITPAPVTEKVVFVTVTPDPLMTEKARAKAAKAIEKTIANEIVERLAPLARIDREGVLHILKLVVKQIAPEYTLRCDPMLRVLDAQKRALDGISRTGEK